MENKELLEQPNQLPCDHSATAQNSLGSDSKDNGSNQYGKFKDAQSLLQAYNNLQSEFTKKCQSLSDLTKQLEDNSNEPSKSSSLNQLVDEFVSSNPQFVSHKDQILSIASSLEGDDLKANVFSAVNKFALENFKNAQDYLQDDKFLEQNVYNNPSIQQKIIQQYFDNITLNKSPTIISNHNGSTSPVTPKQSPKNLSEAGNIVMAMFSK